MCRATGPGWRVKVDQYLFDSGVFLMKIDQAFWESVGANELFDLVAGEENRQFVIKTLGMLTPDPAWTKKIVSQIEAGQIETRCFVSWLSHTMHPRTYLEVGVRRGFSMAMVAGRTPDVEIWGFDLWIQNYGDVKNPGPKFVQTEMKKVGYEKKIHFVSGDSHRTLPSFFDRKKNSILDRLHWVPLRHPDIFDLITVDGDHSLLGAYKDVLDTIEHCTVGGVVVFDDIAPDFDVLDPRAVRQELGVDPYGWENLLGVWRAVQHKYSNFRYFEYVDNPPGVGLAVRLA